MIRKFCLIGLRELLKLVDALGRRAVPVARCVVRSTLHTTTKGTAMPKQLWLEFIEQEDIEALWEGFPEQARPEVTQQYARLMAQRLAARVQQGKGAKEVGDEPSELEQSAKITARSSGAHGLCVRAAILAAAGAGASGEPTAAVRVGRLGAGARLVARGDPW